MAAPGGWFSSGTPEVMDISPTNQPTTVVVVISQDYTLPDTLGYVAQQTSPEPGGYTIPPSFSRLG